MPGLRSSRPYSAPPSTGTPTNIPLSGVVDGAIASHVVSVSRQRQMLYAFSGCTTKPLRLISHLVSCPRSPSHPATGVGDQQATENKTGSSPPPRRTACIGAGLLAHFAQVV